MPGRRSSRFRHAVENTPGIQEAYCPGLQALTEAEKSKIDLKDTRRATGSVNLDGALKATYPNEARWDYGIGYEHRTKGESVVWVEFHPANSHHVDTVLDKLRWLKTWLAGKAPLLYTLPGRYCWMATGRTAITPTSRFAKQIAKEGLEGPFKTLRLG